MVDVTAPDFELRHIDTSEGAQRGEHIERVTFRAKRQNQLKVMNGLWPNILEKGPWLPKSSRGNPWAFRPVEAWLHEDAQGRNTLEGGDLDHIRQAFRTNTEPPGTLPGMKPIRIPRAS